MPQPSMPLVPTIQQARDAGLFGEHAFASDFGECWRALEWMGLQRHLKVLGIFCRLKHRDGKPAYAADLPRFFAYATKVAMRYRPLAPLLARGSGEAELRRFLEWEGQGRFVGSKPDWPISETRYELEVPVNVVSPERYPAFTVQPHSPDIISMPDKQLNILLSRARAAQRLFEARRDLDLPHLAQKFGRSPGYFSRLLRLNYLAPDIVAAILDGTQPPALDRKKLASAYIPLDWSVQRRMLGFPEPQRATKPRNLFGRGPWPKDGDAN